MPTENTPQTGEQKQDVEEIKKEKYTTEAQKWRPRTMVYLGQPSGQNPRAGGERFVGGKPAVPFPPAPGVC